MVKAQREIESIGSQPSGYRREEHPPRTVQRIEDRENMAPLDVKTHRESIFRRSMQYQSEPDLREIQLA